MISQLLQKLLLSKNFKTNRGLLNNFDASVYHIFSSLCRLFIPSRVTIKATIVSMLTLFLYSVFRFFKILSLRSAAALENGNKSSRDITYFIICIDWHNFFKLNTLLQQISAESFFQVVFSEVKQSMCSPFLSSNDIIDNWKSPFPNQLRFPRSLGNSSQTGNTGLQMS